MSEEKKEKRIFTFGEIKPYIEGLEFKHDYRDYVERADIVHRAEKNNAPSEMIDVLLKLADIYYHFYYEIQSAFNNIHQISEAERQPIDKIRDELDQQKAVCEEKDGRISVLEKRSLFYRKVGLAVLYFFFVWVPIAMVYVELWITIASNGAYTILNVQFGANTKWALSDNSQIVLMALMITIFFMTYGFLYWMWLDEWKEESMEGE